MILPTGLGSQHEALKPSATTMTLNYFWIPHPGAGTVWTRPLAVTDVAVSTLHRWPFLWGQDPCLAQYWSFFVSVLPIDPQWRPDSGMLQPVDHHLAFIIYYYSPHLPPHFFLFLIPLQSGGNTNKLQSSPQIRKRGIRRGKKVQILKIHELSKGERVESEQKNVAKEPLTFSLGGAGPEASHHQSSGAEHCEDLSTFLTPLRTMKWNKLEIQAHDGGAFSAKCWGLGWACCGHCRSHSEGQGVYIPGGERAGGSGTQGEGSRGWRGDWVTRRLVCTFQPRILN